MKRFYLMVAGMLISSIGLLGQNDTIPMNFSNWNKGHCSVWEETGDSLRLYGLGSRRGSFIMSKDAYSFKDSSEVYLKWKAFGLGNYARFDLQIVGAAWPTNFSTNNSYNGSTVINDGEWIYTRFFITMDTVTIISGTGGYDNDGGTVIQTSVADIDSVELPYLKNGRMAFYMEDPQAGAGVNMVFAECVIKNANKRSFYIKKQYDFEDSTATDFSFTGTSWEITNSGYNSTRSLYASNAQVGDLVSITVDDVAAIGYDIKTNENNTYRVRMYIDGEPMRSLLFVYSGGSSSAGNCWRHLKFAVPDTSTHNISWEFSNNNGQELWLDNITLYNKTNLPTDIMLSNHNIDENNDQGQMIGILSTDDPDPDSVSHYSYMLVAGAGDDDNGMFLISNDTLFVNTLADYESDTSYNIRVKADAGGADTIQESFVITVNDVNEAPVVNDQTFSVDENVNVGTVVDTVIATDVDMGQILSYDIIDGNTDTTFSIDSNGIITVNDSALLDYETNQGFNLTIVVEDDAASSLTDTALVTVNVVDILETENYASTYDDAFRVYPNPADQIVNIELIDAEKAYEVALYDIVGRCVFKTTDENALRRLDISNQSPGVYTLSIQVGKKVIVKRLIIE